MCSTGWESDWGSLPPELIRLCLRQLRRQVHSEAGGWLTLRQAAQLLAACSSNTCWRAVGLGKLACRVRLRSLAEVHQLAAAALPCSALWLPPLPADSSAPDAWAEQRQLQAAAAALLQGSSRFRQRSGARLRVLRGCPLAVAEAGALSAFPALHAAFPALHTLSLNEGLSIGWPLALRGSRLPGCLPALRCLDVGLPAGGTLCHLLWPAGLHHCTVRCGPQGGTAGSVSGSSSSAGRGAGSASLCTIQPCGCTACRIAGFWATCASLDVQAPQVMVDLAACRALRSCSSLCIVSTAEGGSSAAQPNTHPALAPAIPDLHPWLEAMAPLFAATPRHSFELHAAAACLDAQPQAPAGGGGLGGVAGGAMGSIRLRTGRFASLAAAGALLGRALAAEALPAGHRQVAAVAALGDLAAELLLLPTIDCGSGGGSERRFRLRVFRLD